MRIAPQSSQGGTRRPAAGPRPSAGSTRLPPTERAYLRRLVESVPTRAEKLTRIREALASGDYAIDPAAIADGILERFSRRSRLD